MRIGAGPHCASHRGLGAGPGVTGTSRSVVSACLDGVGARERLFGAAELSGSEIDGLRGERVVEIRLLPVKERLMFVASALGIVEDALGGGAAGLGELDLSLAASLPFSLRDVAPTDWVRAIEQGLLLVEALLLAIFESLLAVSEGLLKAGDTLIGVKVPLSTVFRHRPRL
jgi:hypothetical protein